MFLLLYPDDGVSEICAVEQHKGIDTDAPIVGGLQVNNMQIINQALTPVDLIVSQIEKERS